MRGHTLSCEAARKIADKLIARSPDFGAALAALDGLSGGDAELLRDSLVREGRRQLAAAASAREAAPAQAEARYQAVAKAFGDHALAAYARARLAELAEDARFQQELRAEKVWQKIVSLQHRCKLCPYSGNVASMGGPATSIRQLTVALRGRYPNTVAADKARMLCLRSGIELP